MNTITLALCLLLCSCRVSNEQIIHDTKQCLDAGMAVIQTDLGSIVCTPRKEQER